MTDSNLSQFSRNDHSVPPFPVIMITEDDSNLTDA